MKYLNMLDIVGLTILEIKGQRPKVNSKNIPIEYILFDDGETYIIVDEQDYYDYHDCSSSAREMSVRRDGVHWESLHSDKGLSISNYE